MPTRSKGFWAPPKEGKIVKTKRAAYRVTMLEPQSSRWTLVKAGLTLAQAYAIVSVFPGWRVEKETS